MFYLLFEFDCSPFSLLSEQVGTDFMTTTRVEARFSPPQLSRCYHLLEMNQGNVLDHFHDVYSSEIAVYCDQIGYQIGTIDELELN